MIKDIVVIIIVINNINIDNNNIVIIAIIIKWNLKNRKKVFQRNDVKNS